MSTLQNVSLEMYSFIILIFVLFVPKGMLTVNIYKYRYKLDKVSLLGWLECYTPFRNTYIIKRAFDDPSRFFRFLNSFYPSMIILTVAVRLLFPTTHNRAFILIQLLFTLIMFITLVGLYLTEVYIHWDLCNLLDKRKYKVWAIIMPPLCSYLLSTAVAPHFKKYRHYIDGTFDGNKGQ